jgi:hypothetical protein
VGVLGVSVRTSLAALALLAVLTGRDVAQNGRVPPLASLNQATSVVVQAGAGSPVDVTSFRATNNLPFCPPSRCLYYAGDFDSGNPSANALYNVDAGGADGTVFVSVRPTESVSVTGATFNEFLNTNQVGVNSTPFGARVNMSSGEGGTNACISDGNATMRAYGDSDFGLTQYSYTIKKLSRRCALHKGQLYFLYLVPQYSAGTTLGYLADVEDRPAHNHKGWKNVLDNSFFYSGFLGANYEPTWGSSGACNGIGCDAFSIAVTGNRTP